MPHIIPVLAIAYVVAVVIIMVFFLEEEDFAVVAGILAFVIPLVILALAVDKAWKQ